MSGVGGLAMAITSVRIKCGVGKAMAITCVRMKGWGTGYVSTRGAGLCRKTTLLFYSQPNGYRL